GPELDAVGREREASLLRVLFEIADRAVEHERQLGESLYSLDLALVDATQQRGRGQELQELRHGEHRFAVARSRFELSSLELSLGRLGRVGVFGHAGPIPRSGPSFPAAASSSSSGWVPARACPMTPA